MRSRLAVPALLAAALAGGAGHVAIGAAGTLDRPGVAGAEGADVGEINAALADDSFRFVEGRYVNAGTDLYYAGDEADAGRFLAALAACDGAVVAVRFRTRAEASGLVALPGGGPVDTLPPAARWHVGHNAWIDPGRLTVTVYVGEGGLDVTEVTLPDWQPRPRPRSDAPETAGD